MNLVILKKPNTNGISVDGMSTYSVNIVFLPFFPGRME